MNRILAAVALTVLTSVGTASTVAAQPSEGDHSTGRNQAGFGGGPHCHVLIANPSIRVYPSHRAHLASGPGAVFMAAPCPED